MEKENWWIKGENKPINQRENIDPYDEEQWEDKEDEDSDEPSRFGIAGKLGAAGSFGISGKFEHLSRPTRIEPNTILPCSAWGFLKSFKRKRNKRKN
jgi:hypothetical protein